MDPQGRSHWLLGLLAPIFGSAPLLKEKCFDAGQMLNEAKVGSDLRSGAQAALRLTTHESKSFSKGEEAAPTPRVFQKLIFSPTFISVPLNANQLGIFVRILYYFQNIYLHKEYNE